MAKTINSAKGELMSRRELLSVAAAGSVLSIVGSADAQELSRIADLERLHREAAASMPTPDPLIQAITAYKDGTAAFEAIPLEDWLLHGGEDEVIRKTYGAPLAVLEDWERPATSIEGVIAALRFAHGENQAHFSNPTVVAMVAAALGYFEAAAIG